MPNDPIEALFLLATSRMVFVAICAVALAGIVGLAAGAIISQLIW